MATIIAGAEMFSDMMLGKELLKAKVLAPASQPIMDITNIPSRPVMEIMKISSQDISFREPDMEDASKAEPIANRVNSNGESLVV